MKVSIWAYLFMALMALYMLGSDVIEIKILKAEISYSDSYIWKHCRYNFVSKEDFEEWKMNRRKIAESTK